MFEELTSYYNELLYRRKYTSAHNCGKVPAVFSIKGQTYDYVKKELLKIDDWIKME